MMARQRTARLAVPACKQSMLPAGCRMMRITHQPIEPHAYNAQPARCALNWEPSRASTAVIDRLRRGRLLADLPVPGITGRSHTQGAAMTILYALIARGRDVLAEFTAVSGNFPTVTRIILGKIPSDRDGKMSYVYDQHVFHYEVEAGITYLCMTDDPQRRRLPFAFLEDIKERFKSTYGPERARTAIAFAMNAEFSRVLQRQMDHFNGPAGDTAAAVQQRLEDVRSVMVQNVEQVLERGEKLELLVDKTEGLQHQAFKFERSSRQLRHAMLWQRLHCYLVAGGIAAVIIFFIAGSACSFNFKHCGG